MHPLGGVGRRATVLDRARADADAALVLDAGDLFLPQAASFGKPPDPGEVERRARLLAGAFGRMGTTALLPGERDLAIGLPLLRRLAKQAHVPLLATNLYGAGGKRLFDADRIVDAAGVKVGILGVMAPHTAEDTAAFKAAGIEARDPAAAARDAVASLRARGAKVIIAMVHVGDGNANGKLVSEVPGIDWAVFGHSGMNYEMPEKNGGARMLEAMMQGKHVGRLDLHVIDDRLVFTDRGERAEIETILADHKRQLTDYDKRLGETDPATMRNYYEQRRKEVEAAIGRETALLEKLPARITGSWFENRIIPLDATVPDQPGVAILVDAYNRENVKRAAAGKPVGIGPVSPRAQARPRRSAGAPSLRGHRRLRRVPHSPRRALEGTKHARALETLEKVTAPARPPASAVTSRATCSPAARPTSRSRARLRDVGCEACHGPARPISSRRQEEEHRARRARAGLPGCHTADVTNGEFDYKKFLQAIVGPGHGGTLASGRPPPL